MKMAVEVEMEMSSEQKESIEDIYTFISHPASSKPRLRQTARAEDIFDI